MATKINNEEFFFHFGDYPIKFEFPKFPYNDNSQEK